MGHVEGAVAFGRTVVTRLRQENVTFMAGSIAYQAFMSLAPLLALTVFALSVVGGAHFADAAVRFIGGAVSPNVEPVVRAAFRIDASIGASVIGVVTLLWGSFRVFRGLDTAFSEVYGTSSDAGIVDQIVDGAVALAALLGALTATTLATTVVATTDLPLVGAVVPLVLVGGLFVAFFPMYWRFPDTDVSLRTTVPGVAVAAAGWAAFQVVFELYLAVVGNLDAASVLGAILLLLAWLYFNSLILLVGAVVNAVIVDRDG
ncbi:MAG: YihY/virulence factor BrkB family protein [Haloglomus sp.]